MILSVLISTLFPQVSCSSAASSFSQEPSPAELAAMYHQEGYALEDLKSIPPIHYETLNIQDASRQECLIARSSAFIHSLAIEGNSACVAVNAQVSLPSANDAIIYLQIF